MPVAAGLFLGLIFVFIIIHAMLIIMLFDFFETTAKKFVNIFFALGGILGCVMLGVLLGFKNLVAYGFFGVSIHASFSVGILLFFSTSFILSIRFIFYRFIIKRGISYGRNLSTKGRILWISKSFAFGAVFNFILFFIGIILLSNVRGFGSIL